MELDFTQFALAVFVIAGATELIARLRAKDYWVVVTIITSVAIGALFGLSKYYPTLDIVEGVALGFAASGALKAVSVFGNKSTPTPSKAFEK